MPPALHPNITIAACEEEHIAAAKRLNSLLLPVRYADKFYSEILTDEVVASLTLVALWNDTPSRPAPIAQPPLVESINTGPSSDGINGINGKAQVDEYGNEGIDPRLPAAKETPGSRTPTSGRGRVVGFVRCRLDMSSASLPSTSDGEDGPRLYISTICVLPAFAKLGVGSALLREVIKTAVAEYGAEMVYAHVWEANQEAINWYTQRGFKAEGELVKGYYRRLRPDGAWVIARRLGVRDGLQHGEQIWGVVDGTRGVAGI